MNRTFFLFAALTASLLITHSPAISAVEGLQTASIEEAAKPRYPKNERGDGAEWSIDDGVVEVTYMVGKDGKPFEPLVLRATMEKFIEPALESIQRDEVSVASRYGKAVNSRVTKTVPFRATRMDLRDNSGATAGFVETRDRGMPETYRSYYSQFTEELQSDNPNEEKARRVLDTLMALKQQNYYSISYATLARFRLAEKFGDAFDQIAALSDLIWIDELVRDNHKVLKDDLKESVETNLIRLQIENGQYAEALINYERFGAKNPEIRRLFSDYIDKAREIQASDSFTRRDITLDESGSAHLPLFKRSFLLDEVNGSISNLKLRCDAEFANLPYKQEAQYNLPASWGACHLQIIGEPGSSAALLQQ